ncbi:hypothetical protein IAD21_04415 [Abditibacteriota bacterium]|nr:hypothetical protein IAD21_04415 [Abditibacteriota bacterium]
MGENSPNLVDESLLAFWDEPDKLPAMGDWLKEPRSEVAQSQYAFILVKKHFARDAVDVKHHDIPATLYRFNWLLYLNIDEFISHTEHSSMLRKLLGELVDFVHAISEEYFAYHLLEMLEKFIDRDPPQSLILPLLPARALEKMDAMREMLATRHEDYMRRLDEMYY